MTAWMDCNGSASTRSAHRAAAHRLSSGSLTVTHPFHPLNGQELVVLYERKWAGGDLYVCEGGPLGTIALPASWTSQSTPAWDRPLTIEGLIELAKLVKALKA